MGPQRVQAHLQACRRVKPSLKTPLKPFLPQPPYPDNPQADFLPNRGGYYINRHPYTQLPAKLPRWRPDEQAHHRPDGP